MITPTITNAAERIRIAKKEAEDLRTVERRIVNLQSEALVDLIKICLTSTHLQFHDCSCV